LNVLLVGDVPPLPGGIAVHVQQWARVLAGRGARVQVNDTGKGRHRGPALRPLGGVAGLGREVRAALGSDALVHLHVSGNNAKAWALAAAFVAPHVHGERRLLTVHSGLAPAFLAQRLSHLLLARAALRGCAAVVAVTGLVQEALAALGPGPGQLQCIPAFVGLGEAPAPLPPSARAWRDRFHPLVCWASHPAPVYGLRHALDALASLSRVHPGLGAVVYGPGTVAEAFKEEMERRGPAGRVLGLGPVRHAEPWR